MARAIRGQGWRNVGRQLSSTFTRTPYNSAFQASISNSVAAYYRTFAEGLDARLQGSFGAEVIRLCERIVAAAGAEPASPPKPIRIRDVAPLAPPRALVIGGTGFIGKRLVEALVKRGVGVRVMSRSLARCAHRARRPAGRHRAGQPRRPGGARYGAARHRRRLSPRQGHGSALGRLPPRRRRADARSRGSGAGARRQALRLHRHDRFLRLGRRRDRDRLAHAGRPAHRPAQPLRAVEGRLRGRCCSACTPSAACRS